MKNRKLLALAVLGISLLLPGCVSGTRHASIYPYPDPGKGLVYFFRESHFVGALGSYNIYEGKQILGPMKNGSYFFVQATPGEHTYSGPDAWASSLTINVEAGQTYYVSCSVEVGINSGKSRLSQGYQAVGREKVSKLKYVTRD